MGPLGRMLHPFGDLGFDEAVALYARSVRAAAASGVDLILIETFTDTYDTKAALLAAKENCAKPVFVTNTYDACGKLMTGADPAAMVALIEGLCADALGINCSLGPAEMLGVVDKLLEYSSLPVIVNPNAGLPSFTGGRTVFGVGPDEFASVMAQVARRGASVLGGCCGTNPEYINKMIDQTRSLPFSPPDFKTHTLVSSYSRAVEIGRTPVLIGERINPTGKARLKQALRENDMDYIVGEGLSEEEKGAHILDVNVGLPEIDEKKMMLSVVTELQSLTPLPLQIDTPDPAAMETALRHYNGKALINSVNGKEESLEAILPLAKKYGGVIIALTLDENGIADTAAGRLAIAEKIIKRAEKYGIHRKNIIVDPLALTVSSDTNSAKVTLESIKLIKSRLGVSTSLGVSNISFGLPRREFINAAFFTMALYAGLDAAIMNPHSTEMMAAYHAFKALSGLDANCAEYIGFASEAVLGAPAAPPAKTESAHLEGESPLAWAVIMGRRDAAFAAALEELSAKSPLEVINSGIVPALDVVVKGLKRRRSFCLSF